MDLLRFVPIKLTLGLLTGILINHFWELDPLYSIIPLLMALVGMAFSYQKREYKMIFGILVLLGSIFLGMYAHALAQPEKRYNHYAHYIDKNPHIYHLKIVEKLKPNAYYNRYFAKIIGVDDKKTSGKVLLHIAHDSFGNPHRIDEALKVYAPLDAIKPLLNPHQFNYKRYLLYLGIKHQLYTKTGAYAVEETHAKTIYGMAGAWRERIIAQLRSRNFGNAELGVIQALLLGQRQDIDPETYNDYINAGAVHILAVSGLHVGILLILLQFLLQPIALFPKGRKIKLALIVLLLWGFALLAGFSASIIRAVTMFSFVAYARYLNRPSSTFNILALSMFFILLVSPMLLFQVGFQMCYAAVFAIVWVYPMLERLWDPKVWLLKYGWRLFSVSVAAQLGVLPISLYYFHQFPSLFFVSNLAVIPFLGLILGIGILVMVLAMVQMLPEFLVVTYNGIIRIMNTIIHWVARQELFIAKDVSFDGVQLLLAYGIIISAILLLDKISFRRMAITLVAVISMQIWMLYNRYITQQKALFLVAHQTKNTVLMHQNGETLFVHATDTANAQKIALDYSVGARTRHVQYQPIQNSYWVGRKSLFIIDSAHVLPKSKGINYLLLSKSPNINLERLLANYRPKMILADGSNYKSDIKLWEVTCRKMGVPFHYTGEKGAYSLTMKSLDTLNPN